MGKNKKSNKGRTKSKVKQKSNNQKPMKAVVNSYFSPVDNPFELRVNKKKHDNLGRSSRNEQGVPGISRSRAIDKRKATLLQEYKVRNKSSSMQDRRIGEKRKGMPEEEKIIRRSAAEKARQFKQKSIFNLQDGEDFFTHRGKPLVDIDRYEDPRDASESDDERLDADFVSDANFGGFMTIKKPQEQTAEDEEVGEDGQPKSHKQIIQELILASKKKKFEKAKAADENYELVCKLDDEFKTPDFRNLLLMGGKNKRVPEITEPSSSDKIEYDKLVRELQFETKTGRASDRLKTDDEVAQEDKEKLEQLEKDRVRRMQLIDVGGDTKHRSADDLDDGFLLEETSKKDSDGAKIIENEEESDDNEGEEDEDSEEENEEDASDSYSDVESDSEGENDTTQSKTEKKSTSENIEENKNSKSKQPKQSETEEFLEVPFVIGIPIKYREFESLIRKYKGHYKSKNPAKTATLNVILSRMIKYNKASDRSRLPQLFNYIIRYTLEVAESSKAITKKVSRIYQTIMPHLHSLLLLNPTGCVEAVEKGEIFDDFYPLKSLPIHKILYFHLCSQLFCCTDFNHYVLSPMKSKLLEVLSQYKITDMQSLVKMLYVIRIMFKLSSDSKRYSPEVINALSSILNCYSGDDLRSTGFIIPCFRSAKKLLFIKPELENTASEVDEKLWKFLTVEVSSQIISNVPKRLGIFSIALEYTRKFVKVYEKLPSSKEIFASIKKVLLELKTRTDWPKTISTKLEETLTTIDNIKQKKELLVIAVSNKPKPLRLYEPLIEEDFDGMRKKKAPKGKQETARLVHKVKQEMKSAVREIRKDTSFLAKQQLMEQLEKDAQRKRKVKELMGSLANQEGDYQKSKRNKK